MRKTVLLLALFCVAAAPTQLSSFIPKSVSFTGSAKTLTLADSGTIVDFANGAVVTLPANLPYGFIVTFQPNGAGAVSFAVASGASLKMPVGITKCGPQFSACGVRVFANSNGTTAQYSFFGAGQ